MADFKTAEQTLARKNIPQSKLGQYTLLEKVAQGGMAEVYKAKTVDASGIERLVVIKRILPHIASHPEYIDMLIDEAKIAVHFTHGNIAQVYDLGRVGKDYFIVMEYVDGKTFSQIYKTLNERHQKIPLDILLYCFIELCHGLSYIHRKTGPAGNRLGVVHRDISPQNIILSYAGNVKLIDFGVAKATFLEDKTETGVLKGKFAYMSPEQTRGEKIDHRSDIFSLGILLWEMVTGERLFKRKVNKETIKAVQRARFDVPSALRADVPKPLDKVLRKALGRSPRGRYQDASDLALDLEKILHRINPDFRPLSAAKFLYDLFGPVPDEKELPKPFFVRPEDVKPDQEKTDRQSILSKSAASLQGIFPESSDETTVKEFVEDFTPLVHVARFKHMFYHHRHRIFAVFVMLIFFVGSFYVYLVHEKNQHAELFLKGIEQGMAVELDGESVTPDSEGRLIVKRNSEHSLKILSQGYTPFVKTLEPGPWQKMVIEVHLQKDIPPFGELLLSTTPPGAAVYIDEKDSGLKTPASLEHLPAGRDYRVGFFLSGYDFVSREVRVQSGKLLRLDESLTPTPPVISVMSDPAGAEVFVNGQSRGFTPLTLTDLLAGEEYLIRILMAGFIPEEQQVIFKAGEHHSMDVLLVKRIP